MSSTDSPKNKLTLIRWDTVSGEALEVPNCELRKNYVIFFSQEGLEVREPIYHERVRWFQTKLELRKAMREYKRGIACASKDLDR